MAVAKNKRGNSASRPAESEHGAALKELLHPDILNRLKAKAEELKAEEQLQREQRRKQAEERRRAEQKRLENDFEYLLKNSSMDWRNYK